MLISFQLRYLEDQPVAVRLCGLHPDAGANPPDQVEAVHHFRGRNQSVFACKAPGCGYRAHAAVSAAINMATARYPLHEWLESLTHLHPNCFATATGWGLMVPSLVYTLRQDLVVVTVSPDGLWVVLKQLGVDRRAGLTDSLLFRHESHRQGDSDGHGPRPTPAPKRVVTAWAGRTISQQTQTRPPWTVT